MLGYSPSNEDLNAIDTEYVLPTELADLSENDLNIMHLNVRGLINKQDSLHRLLTALGGKNKVSIVSLNETWLHNDTISKVAIPGYNFVGKCREGRKGGGVGILISKKIRYRELQNKLPKLPTIEYVCVEILMKRKAVLVASLYHPPNQPAAESVSDIKKLLELLENEKKELVLCSDHNLDLLKMTDHSKTMEFLELLSAHNLYPTITKPTRITHASATLIDNIFVTKEQCGNYRSMLLVDDLSDHLPCLVILDNLEPEKKIPDLIWKRSLNDKNLKKMESKLQDIDWETTMGNQSCDESFNTFHDILMNIIDECTPKRPVKTKTTKTSQP